MRIIKNSSIYVSNCVCVRLFIDSLTNLQRNPFCNLHIAGECFYSN